MVLPLANALIEFTYNRKKAVAYAHRWAYGRNPEYYDFEKLGGDCTNFASQCIYAGSGVMNYTPTYGWYYIDLNRRSPSWTGVPYLFNFLTKNQGVGPFAEEAEARDMEPGDIVQLAISRPDFHHTPVVVATGLIPDVDNILVAAHTYDADYRPLSSYDFHKIRFIHIRGVRTIRPEGFEYN